MNHPIFSVEVKQRVKVAADWLDNGARLAGVEARIAGLEKQLDEIREILSSKGTLQVAQIPEPVAAAATKIDVAAFMAAVCDL
jgi:transposase